MIFEPSSLTVRDRSREILSQMGADAMNNQRTMTSVLLRPMPTRSTIVCAFLAAAVTVAAQPAMADFRLCNNTTSRVGIAIGYKENDGWATEGWWNLSARSCETLVRGALVARFYYIYAVD